jgi:hypothetical protein
LWVRESLDLCRGGRVDLSIWSAGYAADGADLDLTAPGLLAWVEGYKRRLVPSIHMPRAASRITLDVTDVRVERLQDISEADALAEGLNCAPRSAINFTTGGYDPGFRYADGTFSNFPGAYRRAWAELWDSINGPGAWDANPWVVVYSFSVHPCNIDQLARAA